MPQVHSPTTANGNPAAAKASLRKMMAEVRDAAAERNPEAAGELGVLFDNFRDGTGIGTCIEPGPVVAGYWPIRSELSPLRLMEELARDHSATALPVTPGPGEVLRFREWRQGEALVDGLHGTREPDPKAAEAVPEIVLVPLLAFDLRCHRLGYGGGYYDRTIAALRRRNPETRALGIAYIEQRVDRLPVEAHDAPLDAILTPDTLFWGAGVGPAA